MINSMPPKLESQDISQSENKYNKRYNESIKRYHELENRHLELSLLNFEDQNFREKKNFASNQHDLLMKTMFRFKIFVKEAIKREQDVNMILQEHAASDNTSDNTSDNYDELEDIFNELNEEMKDNNNECYNKCNNIFYDIFDVFPDGYEEEGSCEDSDYSNYNTCQIGHHNDFYYEMLEHQLDDIQNFFKNIFIQIFIFFEKNEKLYDEVFEIFNSHKQDNTSKN